MTYIVTGGAGFIGSWLAEALQRGGHQVVIIDNLDPKFSYQEIIKKRNLANFKTGDDRGFVYLSDIRHLRRMKRIFSIHRPDGVFHLAAKAGVRSSMRNPQHYMDVNVTGTLNLMKCCLLNDVKSFVYASSSSVYGKREMFHSLLKGPEKSLEPFKETDPTDDLISPYAVSKRAGEMVLRPYSYKMDNVTCLRFFNVYGPRQRPDAALHKFALQMHSGKPITKYGDGETWRDYTHIYDLTKGMLRAMCKKPEGGSSYRIINLGGGKPVKLNDLINEIIRAKLVFRYDRGYPIEELPAQPGDVPYTHCDISKAKTELYWEPTVKFRDGVTDFVRWFVTDIPYRWKQVPDLTYSDTGI